MSKPDGGPAFPRKFVENEVNDEESYNQYKPGMTLRDWFAGMALQGILINPSDSENKPTYIPPNTSISRVEKEGEWTVPHKVKLAYQYADAMIAEREKP